MRLIALALALSLPATAALAEPSPPFQSIARFVSSDPALPAQPLEPGKPISGTIDGAEVERFGIDLKAGDFAAVRLDQTGSDLVLVLFDPQGKLAEIVDQNTSHETETGIFKASTAGRYTVQVAQFAWQAGKTPFTITLTRREPLAATPQARADQLLGTWYDADHAGAAVVVLKDGQPLYRRTLGLADIEHRVPITPRTRFELASVSKQFTGAAIALLIERGVVSRDDPVRKYIPEVPDFGAPITIGQLLDHTSGLRDWDAGLALAGLPLEKGMEVRHVLDFVARQKTLNFAPGSQQLYSNTGYVLLGEVIARATKVPADRWMQDNLFAPLGMADTRLNLDPGAVIADKALSYDGRSPATSLASGASSAAGGSTAVLSSLDDLVRWVNALDRGLLGGKDLRARLGQVGKLPDGTTLGYAYGNSIGRHRGLASIDHLGLAAGFRTRIARFPEQRMAIIFLSNDGDDAAYARSERIEELFLPVEPVPPAEVPSDAPPAPAPPLPALDPKAYEGLYYSDEVGTAYTIRSGPGGLYAVHPINGAIPLSRSGAQSFSSDRWYLPTLEFQRDANGRVTGFSVSTQGARNMLFRRL